MNENVIKHESNETNTTNKPSPSDFDEYLPWACNQLQVEVSVIVQRVIQNEYVSQAHTNRSKPRGKTKHHPSKTEVGSDDNDDRSTYGHLQKIAAVDDKIVQIYTIYDNSNNLVHIKFVKNRNIPRTVLKILGLIVKFHIYLTSITINRGLDGYSIHEICRVLPKSYITDICLDGTFIAEANYYLLLENENNLRQISLARCSLDDDVVKKIAENLVYPRPSSKTLLVLNLSSNKITDEGIKYLSEALKSNRQLVYLNLAGNMISDDGASDLLDVLAEFPMSSEELIESRQRHMKYLNEKKDLISRMVAELRYSEDRKSLKKKSGRPSSFSPKKVGKGLEKEQSLKCVADTNKSITNLDALFDKAENLAVNALGPFTDPYLPAYTTSKDGVMYCCGNNVMSYLNLSYNNISYFTVKKLMNVLMYQKLLNRKPRGLINVCIEGNSLPTSCMELAQIDNILETGLMSLSRRFSGSKKKPLSRGK